MENDELTRTILALLTAQRADLPVTDLVVELVADPPTSAGAIGALAGMVSGLLKILEEQYDLDPFFVLRSLGIEAADTTPSGGSPPTHGFTSRPAAAPQSAEPPEGLPDDE